MRDIRYLVYVILIGTLSLFLFAHTTHAQGITSLIPSSGQVFTGDLSAAGDKFSSVASIVALIFNVVIGASGIIFVVMLLIGGVQYLTGAGNDETLAKAKKLLINSVIGLFIVLSAWALGNWILQRVGLVNSTTGGAGGGTKTGTVNVTSFTVTNPLGMELNNVALLISDNTTPGKDLVTKAIYPQKLNFSVDKGVHTIRANYMGADKSTINPYLSCQQSYDFSADGPLNITLQPTTSNLPSPTPCVTAGTNGTIITGTTTTTGTGTSSTTQTIYDKGLADGNAASQASKSVTEMTNPYTDAGDAAVYKQAYYIGHLAYDQQTPAYKSGKNAGSQDASAGKSQSTYNPYSGNDLSETNGYKQVEADRYSLGYSASYSLGSTSTGTVTGSGTNSTTSSSYNPLYINENTGKVYDANGKEVTLKTNPTTGEMIDPNSGDDIVGLLDQITGRFVNPATGEVIGADGTVLEIKPWGKKTTPTDYPGL